MKETKRYRQETEKKVSGKTSTCSGWVKEATVTRK